MTAPLVGVVGGYGAVGTAAVAELAAGGGVRLRIGGRDLDRAAAAAAGLPVAAEGVAVDVGDPAGLASFAAGCAVLLNCAGPAVMVGDAVARAAATAGVDHVDAAGDDDLYHRVSAVTPAGRRAVLSAGMLPGLTGLLPRLLAAGMNEPARLTGWVGGRDRFTATAALDYLASAAAFGQAGVLWRDGRSDARAEGPRTGVTVPFFPGPVNATAYLSSEARRFAAEHGVRDIAWYSVFDGPHLWQALGTPGGSLPERAARISRAADLDLFGTRPYQLVVAELSGPGGVRTAYVRAGGASILTGVMAALTTTAVLNRRVPTGTRHAAEVLDPVETFALLSRCRGVTAAEVVDRAAADAAPMEEGVL